MPGRGGMGRFSGVTAVNLRSVSGGGVAASSVWAERTRLLGSLLGRLFLGDKKTIVLHVMTGMQMRMKGLATGHSSDKCDLSPSHMPWGQASGTQ